VKPGDRLIAVFVNRQDVGTRFSSWLLHVTIVPWFRLPDKTEVIVSGLKGALSCEIPFELFSGEVALFGIQKDRPATLIVESDAIIRVEQKIRGYLMKKRAWIVDTTTRRSYTFRPHVTFQAQERLSGGEKFLCDRVYVVEQIGNYKEIVGEVILG